MENACYRLGVCAEQSALTAAFGIVDTRTAERLRQDPAISAALESS